MKRNLKSVARFAQESPFTEGQIRWWVFRAPVNGMSAAGAIVRIGRRVFVDVDRFDDWVEQQQPRRARA